MSQASSLSQAPSASTNPLADATAAQLKKMSVKFVQRLESKPEGPQAEDVAEVRKWVELARGDVKKIRRYKKELEEMEKEVLIISVVEEGLEDFDTLERWLADLNEAGTISRSESGVGLSPADSISVVPSVTTSAAERKRAGPSSVQVSSSKKSDAGASSRKATPFPATELIATDQRCALCVEHDQLCIVSSAGDACDFCRRRKKGCSNVGKRGTSVASSSIPSVSSSLIGGVADMSVKPGTPKRSVKRKVEVVGSSPEDQPPRRRSRGDLKAEASGEASSSKRDKQLADIQVEMQELKNVVTTTLSHYSRSFENLHSRIQQMRDEEGGEEEVVVKTEPKPKGKGKGKGRG